MAQTLASLLQTTNVMMPPPTLQDLPREVLVDCLFPLLPTRDLLALASVNHLMLVLASNEVLWKRKSEQEFELPAGIEAKAVTCGWREVYKCLFSPKVFVWG